jgi:NMD protein affecting ribosome stability and mRNA decay
MGTHDRIRSRTRGHTDRPIEEVVHDAYQERYKPNAPAFCPRCEAIFQNGRWQWGARDASAHEHVCPACRRIQDHFPAGYVTLSGSFLAEHGAEVSGLLSNEEARAKAEHPLERIIEVKKEEHGMVVTTTGTHLARRIGEALTHAWKGELEVKYSPSEYLVRVYWKR